MLNAWPVIKVTLNYRQPEIIIIAPLDESVIAELTKFIEPRFLSSARKDTPAGETNQPQSLSLLYLSPFLSLFLVTN